MKEYANWTLHYFKHKDWVSNWDFPFLSIHKSSLISSQELPNFFQVKNLNYLFMILFDRLNINLFFFFFHQQRIYFRSVLMPVTFRNNNYLLPRVWDNPTGFYKLLSASWYMPIITKDFFFFFSIPVISYVNMSNIRLGQDNAKFRLLN